MDANVIALNGLSLLSPVVERRIIYVPARSVDPEAANLARSRMACKAVVPCTRKRESKEKQWPVIPLSLIHI